MNLITLPIVLPILTAIACMLTARNARAQKLINIIGNAALFVAACALLVQVNREGIQVMTSGSWQPPFGITLVADLLAAIMVMISGLISLTTSLYAWHDIDEGRRRYGFAIFMNFMMLGVCGSFLTGDIFNLFVWFEVMLISSFSLMALGGERRQLEGGLKYVILNLFASAIFLSAVAILYGLTGTLNMADIADRLNNAENPALVTTTALLLLVSFGLKAGLFPLFFWLPSSYHTPPVSVSAIFAGLLTKVGVYALMRVFTLIFVHDIAFTHTLLLVISVGTMLFGVLGAVAAYNFRRLLSFHIISQIGYMIFGLALMSPLALAGAIFYLIHHIIVKTNLFFISGLVERRCGTPDLLKTGGMYQIAPLTAVLFFIPAMSLAGIPPLSGFFAKYAVIKAGIDSGFAFYTGVALFVGMLTLYSMTKIWAEAFWKKPPEDAHLPAMPDPNARLTYVPVVLLAACTLYLGFQPEFFFEMSQRAAEQLLNPQEYIRAVLASQPQP